MDDSILFAQSKPFTVDIPVDPQGKIDIYLDDCITVVPDIGDNRARGNATELFQLQMRILFLFILTKNIHRFLLLMRTRSFYSPLRRGYILKVSVQKYFLQRHTSLFRRHGDRSFVRGVIHTGSQSYEESFVRVINNPFRCKESVRST